MADVWRLVMSLLIKINASLTFIQDRNVGSRQSLVTLEGHALQNVLRKRINTVICLFLIFLM